MFDSKRIFGSAAIAAATLLLLIPAGCKKDETPAAAGSGGAEGAAPAPAQPTSSSAVPASAGTAPAPGTAPGAAGATPQADPPVDPATLPAVVARIDGAEVTKADLISRATEARGALVQRGMQPPAPTLGFLKRVLDDIVGNRLLARDLTTQGKGASAAEIDQRVASIRAGFPSEEAFDQSLAARGFDRERLKREVAEGITVSKWVQESVVPSLKVEEAELQKFYDANTEKMVEPEKAHARHLLVLVDPKATAEEKAAKKKRAEELRARIAGGADFAAVATEASDDKQSAARGGDLGWFYKGQMVPAFDKVAFEQPIGKLSDLVESRFGFHVIEVIERKEATKLDFATARPRIEQVVKQRRLEETIRGRINELAGKSKIEILI